jgi:hypothetical protein
MTTWANPVFVPKKDFCGLTLVIQRVRPALVKALQLLDVKEDLFGRSAETMRDKSKSPATIVTNDSAEIECH